VRSSACFLLRMLGITKVQSREYQRLKAEQHPLKYVSCLRSR
jgi:hypothetical protein